MLAAAAVTGALGTAVPADAAPAKCIAIAYSPSGHIGAGQNSNLDTAMAGALSQCGEFERVTGFEPV